MILTKSQGRIYFPFVLNFPVDSYFAIDKELIYTELKGNIKEHKQMILKYDRKLIINVCAMTIIC